ncbi:MAG: STAS domain-containing protein [Candidatus Marinimicrobia bacterium]|nr:STAS domain-containing protein [Candidatus Neomarinimicrobiota bacterium]
MAKEAAVAFVEVLGRGSFEWAGALKAFAREALAGGVRNFVFDLRSCTGMDSTFMGIVAGLAGQVKRLDGAVYMSGGNEHTQRLLRTLGLDRVVRVTPVDELPADWARRLGRGIPKESLDQPAESRLERAENVLAAHEMLVEVFDDNRPKFEDVLTYLRDDVRRARQNPPEPAP